MKKHVVLKGLIALFLILVETYSMNGVFAEVRSLKISEIVWSKDAGTASISVNSAFQFVQIAGTAEMASVLNPVAGLNFRTKASGIGFVNTNLNKVMSFKFDDFFDLIKFADQFSQVSIKFECKQSNGTSITKEVYFRQNNQYSNGIAYNDTSKSFVVNFQKQGFPMDDALEIKNIWFYFLDKSPAFMSENYWGEWDKYQFRLQSIKLAPAMDEIYAYDSDVKYAPDSTRLFEEAIANCANRVSAATVGTAIGQFDQKAVNDFNQAISEARNAHDAAKSQSELDYAAYLLKLALRKFEAAQHIIIYDDMSSATSLPEGELYYIKSFGKYLSCSNVEKGASTLDDLVPGGTLNHQVWRIKKSNSNPDRYTISSILKNSTDTVQGYYLNDNALAWKGTSGNYTDWVIFGNGTNVTLWNNSHRCVEIRLNADGINATMTRDISERNYLYEFVPYTGIEGQETDLIPLKTSIANASALLVGIKEHEFYTKQKSELEAAIEGANVVVSSGSANKATVDKHLSILARTSTLLKSALTFINTGNVIPATILFSNSTVGLLSSGMKIESAGNFGYTSNGSYAIIVLKPVLSGEYSMSFLTATDNANASIVTTITDSIGLMKAFSDLSYSIDTFNINKGGWGSWTGDTIKTPLTGGKTYYLRFNWIGSGSNIKELKFTVNGVISYVLLNKAIADAITLTDKTNGINCLANKLVDMNLVLSASKALVLADTASQITVDKQAFLMLKISAELTEMFNNYQKLTAKSVRIPASITFTSETVPLMSNGMQIEGGGNLGYTNDSTYALIPFIADTTCKFKMTYKACSPNTGAKIVTTITDNIGQALDFKNLSYQNHSFNVTIKDWSTWFCDTVEVDLVKDMPYYLRLNFQVSGSNLKDLKFEAIRENVVAIDKDVVNRIRFNGGNGCMTLSGLDRDARISVYNLCGVLVDSQKAHNTNVSIPFNKGIYILKVQSSTGIVTGKIVVE